MVRRTKNEEVSVSFHYLIREEQSETETNKIPMTELEFEEIHNGLLEAQVCDIEDEETNSKVRWRRLAPIESVERLGSRYIAGVYKASYWGHAYENVELGTIPAESLNLRPFFFLLYLSESGRVYIASQYLGNFGGYTAIKNTIISTLSDRANVKSHSFNLGNANLERAEAREVEIFYSKQAESIVNPNTIGRVGAITFRKQHKDDGFERTVSHKLLSKIDQPRREIRKALSELLRSNELMELQDEEIQGCRVVAVVKGKKKTIYLLDESNFASRFALQVPLTDKGHPEYEPLKEEVVELLKHQIFSRKENV